MKPGWKDCLGAYVGGGRRLMFLTYFHEEDITK